MAFKNTALLCKTMHDHPLFLGPVAFHYDGKQKTYTRYFSAVRDALAADVCCAEVADSNGE